MFTVKQVVKDETPQGSQVRLWEGKDVYLEHNEATKKPNVHFTMADGPMCSLDAGVVFVMNSAGKTVETFRLEGSDWF